MSIVAKRVRVTALALAAGVLSVAAFAEQQPYERYQTIVDRQMFGALPPGFDPTKPAEIVNTREQRMQEEARKKEEEKLKSAIRFSMCNVTPEGATAVGFTDNSDSKNPRHYYLKVGECRDGWTVKEADPATAQMTIVKNIDTPDAIEVSLTIGGDSGKGAGKTARAGQSNVGADRRAAAGAAPGGMMGSLRARRMLREQEKREAAEKAAAERAEREKIAAEKEAAREAREAAEKAKAAEEREQQRQQLLAIQEELKKAREAASRKDAETKDKGEDGE